MSHETMWIVSKRYDLVFIFGGALASLLVPFLVMWNRSLLPVLFWGWLLFFDGTHLWAAYSRTYMDRKFWKTNRALLIGSPVVALMPLLAILFYWYSESMKPIEFFLVFAQGWAYYHLVRQHYGFLSLYDRKSGASPIAHKVNKWSLYLGLWSAYLYFLISHPVNRNISGLPEFPLVQLIALALFTASGLILAVFHLRHRSHSPGTLFAGVCLVLYSLIFFWIAPREPFFAGAKSVAQSFMLLAIMMTLFHNIQYHAIVWHYNRTKYRDPSFGPAAFLSKNFTAYAGMAVFFAALYTSAAWFSTEYPSLTGKMSEPAFLPLPFLLWWGLLFHHYYLDQKIWRVSKTKDLQQQLGIAA